MKIGRPFSSLTLHEYRFYIENHKKYTDFNTLGLYRSICENEKLSVTEKINVRNLAHQHFQKTFDFLQLKDPQTFFRVSTLDQQLTVADERQFWKEVIANQQKILQDKRIKHRSFGIYSKHNCGYDRCPFNGLMVKPDDFLKYHSIHFPSDKSHDAAKAKSKKQKKERKQTRADMRRQMED